MTKHLEDLLPAYLFYLLYYDVQETFVPREARRKQPNHFRKSRGTIQNPKSFVNRKKLFFSVKSALQCVAQCVAPSQ